MITKTNPIKKQSFNLCSYRYLEKRYTAYEQLFINYEGQNNSTILKDILCDDLLGSKSRLLTSLFRTPLNR